MSIKSRMIKKINNLFTQINNLSLDLSKEINKIEDKLISNPQTKTINTYEIISETYKTRSNILEKLIKILQHKKE